MPRPIEVTAAKLLSPTESVFALNSAIAQVSRELVTLLGGPAAAILQVAHPQVALGVERHSRFRQDTFGRLHRTLEAVYTVAFGTRQEAERMKTHLAAIHRKVQGDSPAKYSAFSPDAQLWVLATLIQTAIQVHERFLRPLDDALKSDYFQEMRLFGEYFGLDRSFGPTTWDAFQRYYDEMIHGDVLVSRPECIEVAQAVAIPRGHWWETVGALPIQFLVTELLPSPVREKLGFTSTPTHRMLAKLNERLLPHVIPRLPAGWRYARQYREALTRSFR